MSDEKNPGDAQRVNQLLDDWESLLDELGRIEEELAGLGYYIGEDVDADVDDDDDDAGSSHVEIAKITAHIEVMRGGDGEGKSEEEGK